MRPVWSLGSSNNCPGITVLIWAMDTYHCGLIASATTVLTVANDWRSRRSKRSFNYLTNGTGSIANVAMGKLTPRRSTKLAEFGQVFS